MTLIPKTGKKRVAVFAAFEMLIFVASVFTGLAAVRLMDLQPATSYWLGGCVFAVCQIAECALKFWRDCQ